MCLSYPVRKKKFGIPSLIKASKKLPSKVGDVALKPHVLSLRPLWR